MASRLTLDAVTTTPVTRSHQPDGVKRPGRPPPGFMGEGLLRGVVEERTKRIEGFVDEKRRICGSLGGWAWLEREGAGGVLVGCAGVTQWRVGGGLVGFVALVMRLRNSRSGYQFPPLTMEAYCANLSIMVRGGPIAPIAIQATTFGLKNDMIQQVQNSCLFHRSGDDANKHFDKFLHESEWGLR
ncbi:hypothetical protein Tco_0290055 [Tanacetum coccineum]